MQRAHDRSRELAVQDGRRMSWVGTATTSAVSGLTAPDRGHFSVPDRVWTSEPPIERPLKLPIEEDRGPELTLSGAVTGCRTRSDRDEGAAWHVPSGRARSASGWSTSR